jgi:hypothetical protein
MTDFIIDNETGDIAFDNGDIKSGVSDKQHQQLLMICDKGSFKEFPATCVGASNYLETDDTAALLREIKNQFTSDGMTVNKISFEGETLKIDANY